VPWSNIFICRARREHLTDSCMGASRRSNRIALGLGGLILIGKQQRLPSLAHVPLHIVCEHAKEDGCAHVVPSYRAHKLEALIAMTTEELEKVRGMVARGKLKGSGEIGVRVGRGGARRHLCHRYGVAKRTMDSDDAVRTYKALSCSCPSSISARDPTEVLRAQLSD